MLSDAFHQIYKKFKLRKRAFKQQQKFIGEAYNLDG